MRRNGQMPWMAAALCLLIVILSAGCAALAPITAKQEPLEERVKQYMQAQVDGKWAHAWSFFDSASRDKTSRESFVNRPRKLSFTRYEIKEISVIPPGDQAAVKVTYDLFFMGYAFKGAPQKQNWVKERGGWFVKYEASSRKTPFDTPGKKK